ncbi:reticulophagy regulator 1 isoform X1 [Hippoglossus stenolepis]|uniref:reticulophagy regulator 1 isoform X1 n=1 Tax=Hippoglossus stenolepis TaxID=195615 RepID=UPI001FAFF302|nr:reticulophagy regulator 1 isoform X1 [Hippoglossus stenolepis]
MMPLSREAGAAGGGQPGLQSPEPRGEEPGPGPAGCRLCGLVNWRQRPCRTSALCAAANTGMWFVAFSSLRAYSLLAVLLAALVVMVTVRDVAWSRYTGAHSWRSMTASWEIIDSGQDGRSGTGPHLSDSIKLFLQETSAFKQQNPGKFCLLVCSLCTFLAVVGRYIPGIVILYILVLGVFLWPLISSHDIGLWLEPVLQKLDFGIGELLQKIKENHEKRMMQTQTEEGVESDLSSMFPQLDSTVCKDMSVSDTEVSEVTWTDNGTFNLSEGHTPQTENSEDLDREEAFIGGLQEFPSLDNGATTNGDDDDDLGLPLPFKSKHTPPPHKDQSNDKALELVNQMAGDFIAAAVTAAIQERIEAAVGFTALSRDTDRSRLRESTRLLELAEESDSEVEDFELLDQSELEQLEGELGLEEKKTQVKEEAHAKTDGSASTGFFTKLLRRH